MRRHLGLISDLHVIPDGRYKTSPGDFALPLLQYHTMPYRRTAESTTLSHRYISEYTSGGTNGPTLPQTDSDFDEPPQSPTTTPSTRKQCKNPKCRVEMPPDHQWQRCAACLEKTRKVTAENKERRKHDAEKDELIRSQASEISRLEVRVELGNFSGYIV